MKVHNNMRVGYYVWKDAIERPFVVRGTIGNVKNEKHSQWATLKEAQEAAKSVKDAQIYHAISGNWF